MPVRAYQYHNMDNWYAQTAIFQWNANGLTSKSSDFRKLVAQYSFPLIAISEARVSNSFRLANYVIYTSSRPSGHSRAMLCVRKDVVSTLVYASDSDVPEYVVCKVKFDQICVTIASIYLAPATVLSMSDVTGIMRHLNSPFIACGDFNAHNIRWGSDHSDARGGLIADTVDKLGLCILNDGSPTFLRGNSYASCIDLTLTSADIAPGMDWRTDLDTRGSDHLPILVHHPKLARRSHHRRVRITNWSAFRFLNEAINDAIACEDDLDSFVSSVRRHF